MNAHNRPLTGTRIVDLTRVVSGPLCTRLLADLGADVVKIEPPDGDSTRRVGPFIDGRAVYYAQMNAGKRNVSVDLKRPGATEIIVRLATEADVLVENFRPGVLARYGLDAPTLLAANPRLVYCSISGFGQDGPWKDRKGSAPLVHAEVGTLTHAAHHRQRAPEQEVHQHGDVYTASLATSAILAALLERVRTGLGQHLDVAMAQAAVYVDDWAASGLLDERPTTESHDYGGFDTWTNAFYTLGDGSTITIVGDPVVRFPLWAAALGASDDMLNDQRFATEEVRASRRDEVIAEIDRLTRRYGDFEAVEAVLSPHMAAQVRSLRDLKQTEWAKHRGLALDVAPGTSIPAAPWQSSTSTIGATPVVSEIGADNAVVLEELGYGSDEIDALYASGALRRAT